MGDKGDKMTLSVLLLSGGLDSTTVAAMLNREGREFSALTVDYGQKHSRELESAKRVASHFGVKEHIIMTLDLTKIGGSALTDRGIEVPDSGGEGIPVTYVPARNTIFLSLAVAFAEARDADSVYIGANAVDYSGYPDCRPEYIEAFNRLVEVAVKRTVEGSTLRIIAPLMKMSKAEIIRAGEDIGAPYELSWSCYRGGSRACGRCDSCRLRLKGFAEAGLKDPLEYENQ